MKCNLNEYCFWLVIVGLMFFAIPIRISKTVDSSKDEFEKVDTNYSKSFLKTDTEYRRVYGIFKVFRDHQNKEHNENDEFDGITGFFNLSDFEFSKKCFGFVSHGKIDSRILFAAFKNLYRMFGIKPCNSIPLQVDWREKGIITKIRDQGSCGSCYAHSIISTIESLLALKLNLQSPVELSIQQLLDCSQSLTNGCLGGNTCELLEWLQSAKIKILPNEYYPRTPSIKECQTNAILNHLPNKTITVQVTKQSCLNFTGNEYKILAILAHHGPVIASVNAGVWTHYLGGVIKYNCNEEPNHAVQIVGYDLMDESPHYIVKNSWGNNFGNYGYAKVAIGTNVCGIASAVSVIDIALA